MVRQALSHPGQLLPDSIRTEMEARLQAPFADVRIHTGPDASLSAAALGARAYTAGSHIVFRHGHYRPDTPAGRLLLAHELVHVIQQRVGKTPRQMTRHHTLAVGSPHDGLEHEAEAIARRSLRGPLPQPPHTTAPTPPTPPGPLIVQRYTEGSVQLGKETIPVRISENGNYILEGKFDYPNDDNLDHTRIWCRTGARPPVHSKCDRKVTVLKYNGKNYKAYVGEPLFLADCLHSAEEVTRGKTLQQGKDYSCVKGTAKNAKPALFGVSDKDNVKKAKEYGAADRGSGACPDLREAFCIVETRYKKEGGEEVPDNDSGFPYHAAAVVAIDGKDRITLEGIASTEDAVAGMGEEGVYDIYTAAPGKPSVQEEDPPTRKDFHGRHSWSRGDHREMQHTFSTEAITICLVKIPGTENVPDAADRRLYTTSEKCKECMGKVKENADAPKKLECKGGDYDNYWIWDQRQDSAGG
ncbi:DUF4157 domain-containing protein [Streptomyces sp. NBC_01433]|uniref:eCIS core domain-containing protein n=1 Tax=Streptomyces sp. NBC_01433 TaxID=2903864 RepID=UPI002256F0A9|nr:DUF4157 domain-containing protein [Streptomyces sp. NBC_01433]MCX4678572.1 DUF4157 domain-containing protein [Streptomyces sp. NBC_01433]